MKVEVSVTLFLIFLKQFRQQFKKKINVSGKVVLIVDKFVRTKQEHSIINVTSPSHDHAW